MKGPDDGWIIALCIFLLGILKGLIDYARIKRWPVHKPKERRLRGFKSSFRRW
jgi:hypothetical protein